MKSSISSLQKRLVIGYNRAARMVEAMEVDGIFGPLQSNASREIHKDRLGELAAAVTCDVTARCPTCRGQAGHVEAITA